MRTILSLFFILTLASLPCAAIEISTNLPRNGLLIEHTDVPQSFSCTIQVPKEMSSIDLTQFSASMNGNSLPVTVDNTVELSDRMIISFGTLFELLDNGENVFICSYGSEIERRSFYNDTEAPSCEASPLTQNDLMITCIDDNQIVNNSLEFLNILDPMVTLEPQSQSVFIPVETPLFFRISDSSNNAHYYIHKPNALELELVGGELWDYTNAALSPPPPEGFSQLNVSHAFPIEIKLHIPHYRCEQEQEACHFNGNPNADLIQMHEVLQEAENRRQYAKQMIRDAFHHINSYLVANNYTPFLPIFTDSASELLPIEDDFRYGIRFTTRSSAATSSDDPLPIPTPIGPLLTTANHYYFNPELISPVEALGDQLHIIVVNKLIHLGGVAYPPFGTIVLEAQNNVDLGGLLEDLLQYFEGSELGEILHGSTDALSTAYATYSLDKFKTVHELGHIFGLGHTPHHGSDLMSYGTIKFEIDIAQLKMIAASMYGKEGQGLTWKEQFSKKFLNMGPMVGTTSLDICGSSMMGKGTNNGFEQWDTSHVVEPDSSYWSRRTCVNYGTNPPESLGNWLAVGGCQCLSGLLEMPVPRTKSPPPPHQPQGENPSAPNTHCPSGGECGEYMPGTMGQASTCKDSKECEDPDEECKPFQEKSGRMTCRCQKKEEDPPALCGETSPFWGTNAKSPTCGGECPPTLFGEIGICIANTDVAEDGSQFWSCECFYEDSQMLERESIEHTPWNEML